MTTQASLRALPAGHDEWGGGGREGEEGREEGGRGNTTTPGTLS